VDEKGSGKWKRNEGKVRERRRETEGG